jgi:hypothetical protein
MTLAASPALAAEPALGQLDFAVTGSTDCQRRFREGVLALHSFLYDQAHESFAAALASDPKCAMASWGDAMAYDHAIWGERDLAKGRVALARAAGEEAISAKERAFLRTARALYAADSLKDAHAAWLAAATAMHVAYPDDDEVVLQHALALLAVYGYDGSHLREQMEAGAMALAVLKRRPEHPGAAHYVIHAFDNPAHAILALPAAETYARIAPLAFHAQHMPSHIFVQLGMWRDVVAPNERAYAASVAWEKAHGHTPSKYDWHSYSWIVAALLELGQPARARKLLDDAAALLVMAKDDSGLLRSTYSGMVSEYVVETGRWNDVDALVAPVFAPSLGEGAEVGGPVACAMHAPGAGGEVRAPLVLWARFDADVLRAEAAIRARDEPAVVKRVKDLEALRAAMAPWAKTESVEAKAEIEATLNALLARAHAAARPSADAEKKAILALEHLERLEHPEFSGGPVFGETTREVLGDLLFAAGKGKEAFAEFERDLADHPNRALALLGAARAAKTTGDGDTARARYAALADLWRDAEADVPALAEVRAGMAAPRSR